VGVLFDASVVERWPGGMGRRLQAPLGREDVKYGCAKLAVPVAPGRHVNKPGVSMVKVGGNDDHRWRSVRSTIGKIPRSSFVESHIWQHPGLTFAIGHPTWSDAASTHDGM
jgi:hypothetical protein